MLKAAGRVVTRSSTLALAAALILGFAGQRLIMEPTTPLSRVWPLFAGAAALAILSFLTPAPPSREAAGETAQERRPPRWQVILGVILTILGFAALARAGWIAFVRWTDVVRAAPYYGAGSVLALAGFALWEGWQPLESARRWLAWCRRNWPELLALLAILALGLGLSLTDLHDFPPAGGICWNDEAQIGKDAYSVIYHGGLPWQFPTCIYPVAIAFKLLGASTFTLRLPFAIMGSLLLLPFYIIARRFSSPLPALAGTLLFAVSRWRLGFIRVVTALPPDMLVALTLFALLLRGAHSGKKAPYFLAGLCIALGLPSHASFNLVIALASFLLAFSAGRSLLAWWRRRREVGWPALRRTIGPSALGVLILLASVAAFGAPFAGIVQRDSKLALTERFTSIMPTVFNHNGAPAASEPRAARVLQAALFFNRAGESWPAMNLPGTPAVDPVAGVLLVLGLATACFYFWRGWNLFVALWFLAVMIGGGVLTIDFRSHRFAHAVPAAYMLMALFIDQAWRRMRAALPRRPAAFLAVLAALLILATYFNLGVFFGQYVHDPRARGEFDRDVSSIAATIADFHGARYTFLFANYPFYLPGHDFAWLAGEPKGQRALDLGSVLPSREPADADLAYIFAPPYSAAGWEQAVLHVYPRAQLRTYRGPYNGYVYQVVLVDRASVEERRGLTVRYWAGSSAEGEPQVSRREARLDAQWAADDAPLPAPFVVEWEGSLYAPSYGSYRIWLDAAGAAQIWLDGRPAPADPIRLAQGWHALRVRLQVSALPASARLMWLRPEGTQEPVPRLALSTLADYYGLLVSFFDASGDQQQANLGQPAWQRIDPLLALQGLPTQWDRSPIAQLQGRRYAAIYDGVLHIQRDGNYLLRLVTQGGGATLTLDDKEAVYVPGIPAGTDARERSVALRAGEHPLRLVYRFVDGEFSGVALYWAGADKKWVLVPAEAFVLGAERQLSPGQAIAPVIAPTPAAPQPAARPKGGSGQLALHFVGSWGSEGSGAGQLRNPRSAAALPDGRLVVADTGNRRLVVFDAQGKSAGVWGQGELQEPFAVVASAEAGEVYALDSARSAIEVYNLQGQHVRSVGQNKGMFAPRGLALAPDGALYVAVTGANQIMVLAAQGDAVRRIGEQGSAPGLFVQPAGLVADAAGNIYVADTPQNKRIQRLDPQDRPAGEWKLPWASDFGAPGMAYDSATDTLFLADHERGDLYRYSLDGELLAEWPAEALGAGAALRPVGLCIDRKRDMLYMVDAGRQRVLVFNLGR